MIRSIQSTKKLPKSYQSLEVEVLTHEKAIMLIKVLTPSVMNRICKSQNVLVNHQSQEPLPVADNLSDQVEETNVTTNLDKPAEPPKKKFKKALVLTGFTTPLKNGDFTPGDFVVPKENLKKIMPIWRIVNSRKLERFDPMPGLNNEIYHKSTKFYETC